jgi:hypothetical protein
MRLFSAAFGADRDFKSHRDWVTTKTDSCRDLSVSKTSAQVRAWLAMLLGLFARLKLF